MLTSLSIRDVVLVDVLDLEVDAGLTVLTGETGAGKSIILDALGLALGGRGEAGLVRAGAKQAVATAVFTAPDDAGLIELIQDKGFDVTPGEDLILRRVLSADGRSRAWVNDQPAGVAALREIGALLVEVHGQHETVGLLDWKTHRGLLDAYGGLAPQLGGVAAAADRLKAAETRLEGLRAAAADAAARAEEITLNLADLDELDPREDEETELAGERAVLGAAEKAVADLADARTNLGGDKLSQKLSAALRAVEHARQRASQAGVEADHPVLVRLTAAAEAIDRTMVEAAEAIAEVDAAANAFDFEPGRLDKAEERLFALRAAARKLNTTVHALPALRLSLREQLRLIEDGAEAMTAAAREAAVAREHYDVAASLLSSGREAAAERLAKAVMEELGPLKLDRARFRVALEPVAEGRRGPLGVETARFEIATNAGTPFGPLDAIASGGELARFALAMKAALAGREDQRQPVMIFDEVDQGVGGAVAEAVGQRLKRLSTGAQVLVVTHSPQVAARGHAHWKVRKADANGATTTTVDALNDEARREEIARMLAGAVITEEARAAARALIG
ncbi:DNA repair protein RecN [Brevundimonas subvibrioides]|uniref:DNA repair protein RecN n=1 Tax=Brevundimonas subvibrioides (strain ATCC 15264 / DSM 4735 / LMG 14903 / NBRC 16000 / CB 81) TaxID=633149 RepID=D9QM42_BRESC|nr:DNA repair protein RecN [Brevundimonas subvibrioides]ADL01968.1 DNA repair protein RecN [Brevundimonas subvibrioides ATCC 15264]